MGRRTRPEDTDLARQLLDMLSGGAAGVFDPFANDDIDLPPPPHDPRELTVKVALRHTKPPVWRRLVLPGDLDLETLHEVLQTAMGWTDSHLHRFYPTTDDRGPHFVTDDDIEEGSDGTPEGDVRVDQLLREPGDRFVYEYDFGDGWIHELRLEKVTDPSADRRPRCTAGRRACPPEDVGGPWAYGELVAWHEAGRPAGSLPAGFDSLEHAARWLPEGWEPAAFDADEVDAQLALLTERARLLDDLRPAVLEVVERLGDLGLQAVGRLLAHADRRPLTDVELDEATRHWRVLLDVVGDGVRLTSAGYLPPASTQAVFDGLGMNDIWIGKGNREDLTPPVADLREAAEVVGLLRKAKGTLGPTARARGADAPTLAGAVAGRMPCGRTAAEREAGAFALIAVAAGRGKSEVYDDVAALMGSRGWEVDGGPLHVGHAARLTRLTLTGLVGTGHGWHRELPEWAPRAAAAVLFG